MRTLKYRNTYTSNAVQTDVLRISANNAQYHIASWITTDSSGGTLKWYYVFVDEDGTETRTLYTTETQSSPNDYEATSVGVPGSAVFAIDYHPGGDSGTIRIDVNSVIAS